MPETPSQNEALETFNKIPIGEFRSYLYIAIPELGLIIAKDKVDGHQTMLDKTGRKGKVLIYGGRFKRVGPNSITVDRKTQTPYVVDATTAGSKQVRKQAQIMFPISRMFSSIISAIPTLEFKETYDVVKGNGEFDILLDQWKDVK